MSTKPSSDRIALCTRTLMDESQIGLLDSISLGRDLGFSYLEISLKYLNIEQLPSVLRHCDQAGVRIYALHDSIPEGTLLFEPSGDISVQFVAALERANLLATECQPSILNIGMGRTRRYPRCLTRRQATERYLRCIAHQLSDLPPPTRVAIEPCSYRTGSFLTDVEETMSALSDLVKVDGITVDCYQAIAEGHDPIDECNRAGERLLHMHVAEHDRTPPIGSNPLWCALVSRCAARPDVLFSIEASNCPPHELQERLVSARVDLERWVISSNHD